MHGTHAGVRAAALLTVLAVLGLWLGSLAGPVGLVVAVLIVAAVLAYAWLRGAKVALRAMRAYPVSEAQQPLMYRLVAELSASSRQPVPRLFVSPTAAPNAFTTGRDPRHTVVCCTEGLLARLDERELRAVLAHELAPVNRRNTPVTSAVAALATGVLLAAQLAWLAPGGDGDDDGDDGGGLVGGVLLIVLAPVAAGLLRLVLSRSREFDADAAGVALTGDPLGLAAALRTLDAATREVPLRAEPGLRSTSALLIVDPFRPDAVGRLFRLHPPTADRVARLEARAGYRR